MRAGKFAKILTVVGRWGRYDIVCRKSQSRTIRTSSDELRVRGLELTARRLARTIGDVTLPDGRILNQELIRAGLAWWYEKYSKDTALRDLEEEARHAKRGLWIYPDPVAPWEWRHRMSPAEVRS